MVLYYSETSWFPNVMNIHEMHTGSWVLLTIHRNQRLVSLAVRRVTLAGAMSGGAGRVWIFLEGWLGRLVPTMFTWRIRNLKTHRNAAFIWTEISVENLEWIPGVFVTLAVCILLHEAYCIWTEIRAPAMHTAWTWAAGLFVTACICNKNNILLSNSNQM